MKFSEKVGNRPVNKLLNFGGDPYPDRDTGKTCLGGGMHCPSASSLKLVFLCILFLVTNFYLSLFLSPVTEFSVLFLLSSVLSCSPVRSSRL